MILRISRTVGTFPDLHALRLIRDLIGILVFGNGMGCSVFKSFRLKEKLGLKKLVKSLVFKIFLESLMLKNFGQKFVVKIV